MTHPWIALVQDLQVGDCADKSVVGFQHSPIAFISRKTKFGRDFFKLTIRFGYVELVATSGFFEAIDAKARTAFCGSSMNDLLGSITANIITTADITFIPIQQMKYILKNRIMNPYLKKHSINQWRYYRKRIEGAGFSLANPLSFESNNVIHNALSFVIKTYTYRNINETTRNGLVSQAMCINDSLLIVTSKLVKRNCWSRKTTVKRHSPWKHKQEQKWI